ncbi:hypothetical protein ABE354_08645 [Brevibacillus laterosporus]
MLRLIGGAGALDYRYTILEKNAVVSSLLPVLFLLRLGDGTKLSEVRENG